MSKQLDEEYKKMIAAEVPDLWDRIEAKLPEKQIAKTAENTDIPKQPENENIEPVPKKKKPVIFKILPWVGATTVAALILIVALPAILISNLGKKNQKNATAMPMNMMYESAATAAYDEADFEEAVDAEAEEYAMGAAEETNDVQNYSEDLQASVRTGGAEYESLKGNLLTPFSGKGLQNAEPTEDEAEPEAAIAEDAPGQMQKKSLSGEIADEDFEFYVRIENIVKVDGQNFCECSVSLELEDLSDADKNPETLGVELSDDSEVKAEIGSVYLAKFDGDYLVLLEKKE